MAVHVLRCLHFLEEFRELSRVPQINLRDLGNRLRIVAVMADRVMPARDADIRKDAVAAFLGEQNRRNAGGIGLKCQERYCGDAAGDYLQRPDT